jgi:hypothetical protein
MKGEWNYRLIISNLYGILQIIFEISSRKQHSLYFSRWKPHRRIFKTQIGRFGGICIFKAVNEIWEKNYKLRAKLTLMLINRDLQQIPPAICGVDIQYQISR